MNVKVMVRVLFAALFFFFCLVAAGIVRAETTTQFVVEGDKMVVREVESTVIKVEEFVLPPVDIPEKDLPKVRMILEQGKGDLVLGTAEFSWWEFGMPMKKKTQVANEVISLTNGRWLVHMVESGPLQNENGWGVTMGMVLVILGILTVSVLNQKNGEGNGWLSVAYAAMLLGAVPSVWNEFASPDGMGFREVAFAIGLVAFIVATLAIGIRGKSGAKEALVALIVFVSCGPFVFTGQGHDYVIFIALTIAGSYLLAKLAKRLGWVNPKALAVPAP